MKSGRKSYSKKIKKNIFSVTLVLIPVFIVSINLFSKTVNPEKDILYDMSDKEKTEKKFSSYSTFKDFSEKINQKIKKNEMGTVGKNQCAVVNWSEFIKNGETEYLKILAACTSNIKNIDWDYPIFSNEKKSWTVYVYGKDKIAEVKQELEKYGVTILFENLAYYSVEKEKNEYYYYQED